MPAPADLAPNHARVALTILFWLALASIAIGVFGGAMDRADQSRSISAAVAAGDAREASERRLALKESAEGRARNARAAWIVAAVALAGVACSRGR